MTSRVLAIVLVVLADISTCSPESTRMRGGGPGADPGNRNGDVVLHDARRPFFHTPDRSPVK